jgi:hypothetical protein
VAKKRVGKYPLSFRQMAIERMKDCPSVSALAKELGIDRSNLELRKQVRDLKRVLAEKTLETDFFKGALQKVEARRQSSKNSGGTASTTRSGR